MTTNIIEKTFSAIGLEVDGGKVLNAILVKLSEKEIYDSGTVQVLIYPNYRTNFKIKINTENNILKFRIVTIELEGYGKIYDSFEAVDSCLLKDIRRKME